MDVRAGLGVVTAAVLAGEVLAASPPPAAFWSALPLAVLACARRPRARAWFAVALAALALGTARMRSVTAPVLPPAHVARLALPLRAVLVGRVVAAPARRGRRVVLLVEAEAIG